MQNGMIGKYVIVRCRDAGIHAGILVDNENRECVLISSKRLWRWKPANNAKCLSGVAVEGLDSCSKVSNEVSKIHLTENCEIILCSKKAEDSIRSKKEETDE